MLKRFLAASRQDVPDYFADLPTLTTDRLTLRRLRLRDAMDLYRYGSDPEVSRYCLWEPYRSPEDARAYLRWMRSLYRHGEPSSYAVVLRETDRVIGTMGFMSYQPQSRCAEVGYSFDRQQWGQGLATEALSALLALCFGEMKLNRVEAFSAVQNPASARVMEKCGLRLEGLLRRRV